ncbi:unnamed protein product [Didymodactylos carnosus]|uniref:NAD(P)(+)--arginine ADP-ribosyltransferase n=1 Tax=Didymodactylos carnosus TaxID=1234261 RepID=A0A815G8W2_9BILA|nr:unnamed protein product [Didymodactylos carnosus]CAF1335449.1 unnamed protein product [Didymodactylos carnosus]CAF4078540.1 unnamed protein product [Didymodactylos carnosus]CAF4192226.1 unnamed protein product [Didymodactylos carnosus]
MASKYQEDSATIKGSLRYFDVQNEPHKMLLPIEGYEYLPLMPLEETVKSLEQLIPNIQRKVYIAQQNSEEPRDNLTVNESAAIQLYTMEWEPYSQCLYFVLNSALRSENRQQLKPFFAYLKLLLTALFKLPSEKRRVYRGTNLDLSAQYAKGTTVTWWGLTSCTEYRDNLESPQFLDKRGIRTLFIIECENGKMIRHHSFSANENEILLSPGTQFTVVDNYVERLNTHIIHLREVTRPFRPLQSPFVSSSDSPTISVKEKNEMDICKPSHPSISSKSLILDVTTVIPSQYRNKWLEDEINKRRTDEIILLSEKRLADQDVEMIAEKLQKNTKWRQLWLHSNQIMWLGGKYLSEALTMNSTLEQLWLGDNSIRDRGVKWIAMALKTNKKLKVIALNHNGIGDDGCRELSEMLKVNQTLEQLILSMNKITDKGAKFIADALAANTTLTHLYLNNNQITNSSIDILCEALKRNRVLIELDLSGNTRISESAKDKLEQLLKPLKDCQKSNGEYCVLS